MAAFPLRHLTQAEGVGRVDRDFYLGQGQLYVPLLADQEGMEPAAGRRDGGGPDHVDAVLAGAPIADFGTVERFDHHLHSAFSP